MKEAVAKKEDLSKNARILIVDDQEANVRLLEGILKRAAGYHALRSTTDPREVMSLYVEFQPDLILLDLHMPHVDGFGVMDQLKEIVPEDVFLPILVLTADVTPEAKQRALASGAKDFLAKPFDPTEVLLRIKNLLETRTLHLELRAQLSDAHLEVIDRLAIAAEYRDDETGEHIKRVGQTSALVARALKLPPEQVLLIRRAATLHDVGKIGIPEHILLKPGRLTPDEFNVMKSHTTIGAKILSGGQFPLLQMAEVIALTHHERWDGSGYPRGLKGEAIPLLGRIVAVADVFDILTHPRPYKKAWLAEEAIAELQRAAGTQFDPSVVEVFLGLHEDTLAPTVLKLRLPIGASRSREKDQAPSPPVTKEGDGNAADRKRH
ncbi:MAG TPA: HD domain-containing phosphohydrolase [bacterium]|nr:HD domain-containing phosphohydrolase [bacterium]